jgi:hypothetical protein
LPHQKAVPGIRRSGRVVAAARRIVELGKRQHDTAIGQFVPDLMIALRTIDGTQDHDVGFISDLPPCVARREGNVGNDGIARIGRVKFTLDATDQFFIWADIAERAAFEDRRLNASYLYLEDAGLRRLRGRQHGCADA